MATAAIQPSAGRPRDLVADVIASEGPAWRNLADNIRAGGVPNMWIRFALKAAEAGMRFEPADEE